ncbi:hypothetical protein GCM10007173_21550 [Glutamicibacter ardleyensis]|uniref:Uncharacterized protein n=1 Tax=Glutamicibacter ardleyensis TaxID=225894 RepID=A0ABQ2DPK5_9MICC|nr:hypothetical protein GCM10007173_21550 [Glutamicibacter ardleyensis]
MVTLLFLKSQFAGSELRVPDEEPFDFAIMTPREAPAQGIAVESCAEGPRPEMKQVGIAVPE